MVNRGAGGDSLRSVDEYTLASSVLWAETRSMSS